MEVTYPFSGAQFPPGFRFHPTDQELIIHYLTKKVTASLPPASSIIAEIDLYKYSPWELPEKAFFGEGEWFFFSPRDRKYPNGVRPNRAAGSGYWKATGTDRPILAIGGAQCLGVKKALVFYKGRPPKGIKTDWIMHEYRLLNSMTPTQSQKQKGSMRLDDWVLCRVRQRDNLPPSQNEEKSEIWNPMPAFLNKLHQSNEKQQLMLLQADDKEKSNLSEISIYNKAGYLQTGNSEEAESNLTGSGSGGGVDGGCFGPFKTKLSFGPIDELMLLQPSKTFQFSPDESNSEDQGFLEFLV